MVIKGQWKGEIGEMYSSELLDDEEKNNNNGDSIIDLFSK